MLSLIRCPFHPRVTAVACKRSQSFCQKRRWQVTPKHAYTLYSTKLEWATMPLSKHSVRISRNEPTYNLLGNIQLQSSQLTEPLWTDLGVKSGFNVRLLISTSSFLSAGRECMVEHSPKMLASEERATTKLQIVFRFLSAVV